MVTRSIKTATKKRPLRTWWVYVLRCADDSLYTGITKDIVSRVAKHNDGTGAKYTRSRRPVRLVWKERKRSESYARKRELEIKSWTKQEKETFLRAKTH